MRLVCQQQIHQGKKLIGRMTRLIPYKKKFPQTEVVAASSPITKFIIISTYSHEPIFCQSQKCVVGRFNFCQLLNSVVGHFNFCQSLNSVVGHFSFCQSLNCVDGPFAFCRSLISVVDYFTFCQSLYSVVNPFTFCQ